MTSRRIQLAFFLGVALIAPSCKPKPITVGSASESRAIDALTITADGVAVTVGRRFGYEKDEAKQPDTRVVLDVFDAKGKQLFPMREISRDCHSVHLFPARPDSKRVVFVGSCSGPSGGRLGTDFGAGPVPGLPADDYSHIVVAMIDLGGAKGQVLWTQAFGMAGGGQFVDGAGVDASGDIVLAGTYANGIDFGVAKLPEIPKESRRSSSYLAKLDGATGKAKWAKLVGGTERVELRTMALLPNDDVIVAGTFRQELALEGSAPRLEADASAKGSTSFLARFDRAGTATWSARPPAFPGTDLLLSDSRLVALPNGNAVVAACGGGELLLAGVDGATGKAAWERRIKAKSAINPKLTSDPSGNVYVAFYASDADFGKGPVLAHADGLSGGYLAKLGDRGEVVAFKTYGGTFNDAVNALAWNPKTKTVTVARQGTKGPPSKARSEWLVTETWLESTIEPATFDTKPAR